MLLTKQGLRFAGVNFCLLTIIHNVRVHAKVTVYYVPGQTPLAVAATQTSAAAAANYTGSAAYSPLVLNAPALPNPLPNTSFFIQLQTGGTPGVSIKVPSAFLGFSIEFSVINQVLGRNSSYIQVPFLNLMANIVARSGRINIRVGGNTQETATLVQTLPDGRALEKNTFGVSNPTNTPPLVFTPEVLYMMNNISSLNNVKWYLGIPFNDTNWRLEIVEYGERILGDNLIAFQVGNEPDLYVRHDHRPQGWGIPDYNAEFGSLIQAMDSDERVMTSHNALIGPSIASADWVPQAVWDSGFVDNYYNNLIALAVEHYPMDNCAAQFPTEGSVPTDPQTVFPFYLNHDSGRSIVAPYLDSTAYAQTKNKPFLMFETNTASCGGFAGISDSFGSALWALDYGLQMAYSNFSGALLHVGGQNVFYNPFTPPPTNQSTFHQWTIGPTYYSVLIMAEVLGRSDKAQVLDLLANDNNTFTPAYAIYENDVPVRLALFNYMTDQSGQNDYTVAFAVGGSGVGQANASPQKIRVKYLAAESVAQKVNYTWAGQTFGNNFESDGRLKGSIDIKTLACNVAENICRVTVPAPGFALVFLTDDALEESQGGETKTFATTAMTKTHNTATVDPAVLATSNGHKAMNQPGGDQNYGSTSMGRSGAVSSHTASAQLLLLAVISVLAGVSVLGRF